MTGPHFFTPFFILKENKLEHEADQEKINEHGTDQRIKEEHKTDQQTKTENQPSPGEYSELCFTFLKEKKRHRK